ncbi:MAG: hypothetical protein C4557_12825 [Anaerolineaceae bacterium]|jgi:precorrin-6B methylase 2|nr:MAG: hypothetical protein C4557_12825 [Anaerolineaceae bacterium]
MENAKGIMEFFIGVIAVFVIFTALLWLLVPAWYGLPPISVRRERIRRALELTNPQAGETLYDLGSGHGRVLVIAAKEFGLEVVGIEAGPVQRVVSRVNALWNGVSSKVRIEAGDFYKSNLSDADIVFAYLTSDHGKRLGDKLKLELKPGARVVTVSFDLTEWQPAFFERNLLFFVYEI